VLDDHKFDISIIGSFKFDYFLSYIRWA